MFVVWVRKMNTVLVVVKGYVVCEEAFYTNPIRQY